MSSNPDQVPDEGAGVDHTDADRGNLDGSNATDAPRDESLDQAQGNGSFDSATESADGSDGDEARMASDAGESGQDGGSMS